MCAFVSAEERGRTKIVAPFFNDLVASSLNDHHNISQGPRWYT
nr:MAG TPA: hypothetical protein [Caudoviricetes sp.]